MVTVIGLIILFLGTFIILPFDSTLSQPLPSFIYILFALFIFGGQTFDAIDGKHARATNRSSPLGQLMDHGCDALSNSSTIIMIAQSLQIGPTYWLVLIQVITQLAFFTAQWEELHTGLLLTQLNNIGVTEVQFASMALCLVPCFISSEMINYTIGGYRILDFIIASQVLL